MATKRNRKRTLRKRKSRKSLKGGHSNDQVVGQAIIDNMLIKAGFTYNEIESMQRTTLNNASLSSGEKKIYADLNETVFYDGAKVSTKLLELTEMKPPNTKKIVLLNELRKLIRDNLQLFIPKVYKLAFPGLSMKMLKNAAIDLLLYTKAETAIFNVSNKKVQHQGYTTMLGRLQSESKKILELESKLPYKVMNNSYISEQSITSQQDPPDSDSV